ncbi:hypothetical protein [Paenibacillus pabuli]|uniref:hypothetical protein n=1 Tax=Paenibacillus pabuli TaxID=1472 RepID=UPI003CF01CAA
MKRAAGKFGFRSLLPPECFDWNPFFKRKHSGCKGERSASTAQIFPSASVKLGDEAINDKDFSSQIGSLPNIKTVRLLM